MSASNKTALKNHRFNEDIAYKIKSGELLLGEKYSRSKVWQVFSRIMNQKGEEQDFVYCNTCENVYKFNQSQTSNLVKHSCYVAKFANIENNEVSIVKEEKPTIQYVQEVSPNDLTQLLTKWIIQNCRSCDLIRSEGLKSIFREFLKLGTTFGSDLDVSNLLPSLSEVSENITVVYKGMFESVKQEIASFKENGFAFTTDIWSDNLTEERYIALSIHYLKNGAVRNRLLGFHTLEGELITNENIAESVQRILEEFDCQLSSKCFCVADGAPSFIESLTESQNLPCISQLLNKALLKSAKQVSQVAEMINDCSKLVNLLKRKRRNSLSCKLSHKSHHNRSLAIYKMLNSILINWNDIEQVLENFNETFTLNKNKLIAILYVLQPFEEAIETLEDESQPTIHLVMAYLHELRKFCLITNEEYKHWHFVKSLQENILLNLEEIVAQNTTTLHKMAVFLYPPTNKLLLYSDKEKQTIEDECIRLLKNFEYETKPVIKEKPVDQPLAFQAKRQKLFVDFLESEESNDSFGLIRQEIQNYKNTRVALSPYFNLFHWWETQKNNFPLLYQLSCTVLATPATSAATKRVIFNAKSLISEKYRQDSTETDIEKIMFISTNASGLELDKYFTV